MTNLKSATSTVKSEFEKAVFSSVRIAEVSNSDVYFSPFVLVPGLVSGKKAGVLFPTLTQGEIF